MSSMRISRFFLVAPLIAMTLWAPVVQADGPYTDSVSDSALNNSDPRYRRATIHPTLIHLEPGAQQKFKVVMKTTRLMAAEPAEGVTWSVNDIPGGDATVGTIDAEGLYTAPATIPGRASGRMILLRTRRREAPSDRAASIRLSSIACRLR